MEGGRYERSIGGQERKKGRKEEERKEDREEGGTEGKRRAMEGRKES